MKSLLSLEGLRPPLSRDSSTYTHAMSYFASIYIFLGCPAYLSDSGKDGFRIDVSMTSQSNRPSQDRANTRDTRESIGLFYNHENIIRNIYIYIYIYIFLYIIFIFIFTSRLYTSRIIK